MERSRRNQSGAGGLSVLSKDFEAGMSAHRADTSILTRRAFAAVLLIATVAALLIPAAADAKTRFRINGAGWGHGVGLSAYGAYGYAKHGRDYRDITGHYFKGTK